MPAGDVRSLFDVDETEKTSLVKKSIAEGSPVLFSVETKQSFEIVDGAWKPSAGSTSGREGDACADAMIAVGYDDTQQGGAFEVVSGCEAQRGVAPFWMRYDDFARYSACAVEAISRHDSTQGAPDLVGSVRFEDTSGALMRALPTGRIYRLERAYPSGTEFRVYVSSFGAAYVYVFASDISGAVYPVFPAERGSAHLAYHRNRMAIPDEENYLHLDDKPGTDYVCALYSTSKIDFPAFVGKMEKAKGSFPERLQEALADDLVPESEVQYASSGELSFAARKPSRPVVPVVVEIKHM